ncbi:UDP-N-acetylglucosamine 2-epimerase (hydrolyzing) [Schaedlerella arabinosiphila]|uniref:UDP-N-acetylglucosamine 2-epimerase (Hydrolyzing) n=1 Tax=Schaedlerella arabinosiphila TaxID=2044587 RepID=A0A426DRS1_9FIRM|nr:UDP-N-acetylglucosamine 2-epimerase [Schaedlerella arabinosiphila]RRK35363.1 UDP-N-acetylglucosamine 2-epimerase (hydrolyzing) [Schaedlerella arabinosiphila]
MGKIYRVAYATGSRADYGIVRHYLEYLDQDAHIELEILVTGALLSQEYGHQVDLIREDGFQIGKEIEIPIDTRNNAGIIKAMADALDQFGELFQMNKYDLLIVLGDRYEMLSVSIAAAMYRIPILHIHGGEATYANYDEFIRHSITKMARVHFASTEEYKNRIIQMGEDPQTVFNLGALGAENCKKIDMSNVPEEITSLPNNGYLVILFHPETLKDVDAGKQMKEVLKAVDFFQDKKVIFIGSNADTHSDQIRNEVAVYVRNHSNAVYFENLHTDAYHYLLKNSICLIGNSSSGIIEAPSLGVWTINVGDRQKGRVRGESVIDVPCIASEMRYAVSQIYESDTLLMYKNPYYKENTAINYYKKTCEILEKSWIKMNTAKEFFDVR